MIGGVAVAVADPEEAQDLIDTSRDRVTPAGNTGAGTPPPPTPPQWMRYQPDPFLLGAVEEAHAAARSWSRPCSTRFSAIYGRRVADLTPHRHRRHRAPPQGDRIPTREPHGRRGREAAGHVLTMCIRAMDHVLPIDITFGEFLWVLITADHHLVPNDAGSIWLPSSRRSGGWASILAMSGPSPKRACSAQSRCTVPVRQRTGRRRRRRGQRLRP